MSMLAILLAVQSAPQISVERIDENRLRLSISGSKIGSVTSAQAALMPTARRLCGARPPSFGSFRARDPAKAGPDAATGSPASFTVEQEVFCGMAKPTAAAAALPLAGWQPSEADQQAVLGATYSFFAAKDAGRYADAWSMLSKDLKTRAPAADWQRDAAAFNARAGGVRARRVTEITWYHNPPGAPEPGLYVAADFSAEFANFDAVCGYLMWRLQPNGSFVLTREEQNVLGRAAAKNVSSIDRQPLRVQMGCKD